MKPKNPLKLDGAVPLSEKALEALTHAEPSRRDFLKTAGVMMIGFGVGAATAGTGQAQSPLNPTGNIDNTQLRSEEHTSELQSLRHLVCSLLLQHASTSISPHSIPTRRSSALGAVPLSEKALQALTHAEPSRRDFLKTAGVMMIGFGVGAATAGTGQAQSPLNPTGNIDNTQLRSEESRVGKEYRVTRHR